MGQRAGGAYRIAPRGATRVSSVTPVRLPQARATPVLREPWRWQSGLTAAYASEAGRDHARNEDCCSHVPSAERPGFCGVADGVVFTHHEGIQFQDLVSLDRGGRRSVCGG